MVNCTGAQPAHFKVCVQTLVLLLCLALAAQGAHVCASNHSFELGVRTEMGSTLVCQVCAIAHSLVFTVFFLLLFLMPSKSLALFHPVETRKSLWREVRMYKRPPPAL